MSWFVELFCDQGPVKRPSERYFFFRVVVGRLRRAFLGVCFINGLYQPVQFTYVIRRPTELSGAFRYRGVFCSLVPKRVSIDIVVRSWGEYLCLIRHRRDEIFRMARQDAPEHATRATLDVFVLRQTYRPQSPASASMNARRVSRQDA